MMHMTSRVSHQHRRYLEGIAELPHLIAQPVAFPHPKAEASIAPWQIHAELLRASVIGAMEDGVIVPAVPPRLLIGAIALGHHQRAARGCALAFECETQRFICRQLDERIRLIENPILTLDIGNALSELQLRSACDSVILDIEAQLSAIGVAEIFHRHARRRRRSWRRAWDEP